MRTTLSIDDDLLDAARDLAARRKQPIGTVISDMLRQALKPRVASDTTANGVPLLPLRADARPVTLAMVNASRDDAAE